MSHGLTTTTTRGHSLPISLSHRLSSFKPALTSQKSVDRCKHGQLFGDTALVDDEIQYITNPGWDIDLSSHENSNKLEEWQLISDEVLLYFTGKSWTAEDEDVYFFKNVAGELRSCHQKLESIRLSHNQCQAIRQSSAEVNSLASSSTSVHSEVSSFSKSDLYAAESFQYPASETSSDEEAVHSQTPKVDESFSSISSIDLSLSSFELISSQKVSSPEADDLDETEVTNPPLCPQELLIPYVDNNSEDMLFSLVQDFSLKSPTDSQASDVSNRNTFSNVIDKQPKNTSIPFLTDLAHNSQHGLSDTTVDSSSSLISEPISQETLPVGVNLNATTEGLRSTENNEGETNHEPPIVSSNSVSLKDDAHISETVEKVSNHQPKKRNTQVGRNKPKRSGIHRSLDKWWSPTEDKRDISFLKIPSVSVQNLVFHVNQNGAVKVGEGSFGSVFLADLYMNGSAYQVVVKDFSPKGVTKPFEILEEARVLTHLMDTAFIPFFYGVLHVASPQRFALVQEFFAQGRSLQNLLEDDTIQLSQTSWLSLCVQMTVGLDRFHQKGILLNDIKKDNILVDSQHAGYILKFIDMGLASYKSGRVFFGTKDYMQQFTHLAPEVRQLEQTSPASDIYSIGKILFCIAKTVLFPAIKDIVLPCLNQCPEKRPSIRVIVSQLKQVRDSFHTALSNFSTPESDRRWFC